MKLYMVCRGNSGPPVADGFISLELAQAWVKASGVAGWSSVYSYAGEAP